MDKLIYVSMSSASETMLAQAGCAQNLANLNTPGFKATLVNQRAMPLYGDGLPSRVYVGAEAPGYNFNPGSAEYTGNALDLAIVKEGFFAVEDSSGQEAYTRRADLRVENNVLVNGVGQVILGDGGAINIPPARSVDISENGLVTIVPLENAQASITVGRLKLVNPEPKDLQKNLDGLFVLKSGANAEADLTVKVRSGVLEGSNVNAVAEMIDLISLARQHELSLKMLDNAKSNDQASAQLLHIT